MEASSASGPTTLLMNGDKLKALVKQKYKDHDVVYQSFLHKFDRFAEGQKNRHDFFCEIAHLFRNHQDLVAQLREIVIGPTHIPKPVSA